MVQVKVDQVLMRKISQSFSEYKIQLEHRTLNYGEMSEAGEGPAHMILYFQNDVTFIFNKYDLRLIVN